jgi:hypothetical protein
MSGPHSGKFGVVNGQSTVRNWSIGETMAPAPFVASNTKGGTGRRTGVKAWAGSFNQFGGIPTVLPGQLFAFAGYTAPDNDTLAGVGTKYSGQAIIDQLVVNFDWTSGAVINTQSSFSGHLALTVEDGAAALADNTDPDVPSVCCAKIEVGGMGMEDCSVSEPESSLGDASDEWENLAQATLTITAANQSFVNSSTNCWTGRKPGNIDWTLAVVEQQTQRFGGIYEKIKRGNSVELKLFIDDENYWWLKWGMVHDFSDITVERESGAIIARTVNISKNGFLNGNTGLIRLPGAGSNFWPEA